jgi:hypothetical protein
VEQVHRYRLTSALLAVKSGGSGSTLITVHAGLTVTVTDRPKPSGLVDVLVDGDKVSMFLRDLEERAEQVASDGNAA